jgi:hypothetical protein
MLNKPRQETKLHKLGVDRRNPPRRRRFKSTPTVFIIDDRQINNTSPLIDHDIVDSQAS